MARGALSIRKKRPIKTAKTKSVTKSQFGLGSNGRGGRPTVLALIIGRDMDSETKAGCGGEAIGVTVTSKDGGGGGSEETGRTVGSSTSAETPSSGGIMVGLESDPGMGIS
jgi:hypothetical protein